MTYTRAVITPAPGLDPIPFTHEGLTVQDWQAYAVQTYGWKAEVRVIEEEAGNEVVGEGTAWRPFWTAEMERVYGWPGKKRRKRRPTRTEAAQRPNPVEAVG
jgi:hypothetical protein